MRPGTSDKAGPVLPSYVIRDVVQLESTFTDEWILHRYRILLPGDTFNEDRFAPGVQRALDQLPRPAEVPGRPGLGFLIEHQGNGIDYIVLAWWDRNNELPLRVFVRPREHGAAWRPAQGSESVCVWDLEVIWNERQQFVRAAMGTSVETARSRHAATSAPDESSPRA